MELASMADENLVALLRKGVAEWNAWRKQRYLVPVDLTGANLSGVDLSEAYVGKANPSQGEFH